MKLRVFFTLHELSNGTTRYSKTKQQRDFDESTSPDTAYASLWKEFGKLGTDDRWCPKSRMMLAPMRYAAITGHSVVDPEREQATLETFTAYEVPLLDALTLKACLSDAPKKKLRRTW